MSKAVTSVQPAPEQRGSAEPLPPPILVDTPAAYARMMDDIAGAEVLALDTESDSFYRYSHKVCLIQLSIASADYIIDPLRLSDLAPLGAVLADSGSEKVFHAAENDILALKRDFGFDFANVFDTMLAARVLGWRQVGLAALLAEHFGVEQDKRIQLTDWGQRPLTARQLNYGRLDTHYLLPLRELLIQELRARRRWREACEAFAEVVRAVYVEKPFDPDGFWRMKGARDLRPAELAVLRELYLWRDAQARALDRPPFKILGDGMLVELSRTQPQELDDLYLSRWQMVRFGSDILAAVARGRKAPAPQPPARNHNGAGRPDAAVAALYDRLRSWRTQRAAERGVETDIVLNNEALMAIARARPASPDELAALDLLGPWKLDEYGPELLSVVAGEI